MTYDNALRRYVQTQLPAGAVLEAVHVEWDQGGIEQDPTYGGVSHREPSFHVEVRYVVGPLPVSGFTARGEQSLDFEMTFSALLAAVLGVDQ